MERWWVLLGAVVLLLPVHETTEASAPLSVSDTLVFGPGIHRDTSFLPLNYFYIQARDSTGNNITDCPEDVFVVDMKSPDGGRVIRRQTISYLGRGLFLIQYRMYMDYQDVSLSVTHNGQHLSGSPYSLGAMFHEDCACPLKTVEDWFTHFKCPAVEAQINQDLEPFRAEGVNLTGLFERAGLAYSSKSFVHYSLVNGQLYARTFGSIVGFKFLSDMILLSMINKVQLPDMELMVNLGDWPLNRKGPERTLLPTFSWCGSDETWDIVWPTWELMKSIIMGMDRVSLTILSAQETQRIPWEDRDPRVFFRGRDSNKARLELVKKYRSNTELFDVGIVAWFFFKHEEEVYGPVAQRVGFNEFFKYKYQINIDGTVAAYRFPYLMAGGSLIFKQDSGYYEHFYSKLVPWEHYVPVQHDLSDLLEQVNWAKENDDRAEEMARNAVEFVRNHLVPEHIYCYMTRLLDDYSKLLVGTPPQIHPGMELVRPEVSHDCSNICSLVQRKKKMNDEL